MFMMIRMGKRKKDRDKDWTLCKVLIMLTQYGVSEKKMALYFPCSSCWKVLHHAQFVTKSLLLIPVIFMEQFLLLSQYCSFSFSQVTSFYCPFRLYWHHTISLLSTFIITQDLIVNYNFHHIAAQNPVFHFTRYFIMQQLNILLSIYNFHHAATQNPIVNL